MATIFDTLPYVRRLETSGVDRPTAEAHAEAIRDYVMADLVIRKDLEAAVDRQTLVFQREMSDLALKLTVRLAVIVVTSITLSASILGFVLKLH